MVAVEFVVERDEKYGGKMAFKDYASLEGAFAKEVSNQHVIGAVLAGIVTL